MKELSKEIDSLRVAGNGHSLLDEMWANKPFARKMQELDADILKIAVMPQNSRDVLTLLSATEEMTRLYAERPLITMSMGGTGLISRPLMWNWATSLGVTAKNCLSVLLVMKSRLVS